MKVPRLARRQKLLRNLLIIAALIFCVEWHEGFPAWRMEMVVRRAENAYLLEPVTTIWFEDVDPFGRPVLYGENDGQLISVVYKDGVLGKYLEDITLYRPDIRDIIDYQVEMGNESFVRTVQVIGFLEDAARMELEMMVDGSDRSLTLEGRRVDGHRFVFAAAEESRPDNSVWLETIYVPAVLRIYDSTGQLLETRTYDMLNPYLPNESGGDL